MVDAEIDHVVDAEIDHVVDAEIDHVVDAEIDHVVDAEIDHVVDGRWSMQRSSVDGRCRDDEIAASERERGVKKFSPIYGPKFIGHFPYSKNLRPNFLKPPKPIIPMPKNLLTSIIVLFSLSYAR